MRAPGRSALAVLLVAASAAAQTTHQHGPTMATRGPSIVGSGPAAGGGPAGGGGATGTPAPSWMTSMLAAWMLDEASGARVNIRGNSACDLALGNGPMGNNTTQVRQGTASLEVTSGQYLATGCFPVARIVAPFTCVVWMRPTVASGIVQVLKNDNTTMGFDLQYNRDTTQVLFIGFVPGVDTITASVTTAANVWTHLAVTQSSTTSSLYVAGALVGSKARAYTAQDGNFQVSNQFNAFVGQVDEVACATAVLSAASLCRICSCQIDGSQCTCNGTAFATKGRNTTDCGTCTLPVDCTAAAPS